MCTKINFRTRITDILSNMKAIVCDIFRTSILLKVSVRLRSKLYFVFNSTRYEEKRVQKLVPVRKVLISLVI